MRLVRTGRLFAACGALAVVVAVTLPARGQVVVQRVEVLLAIEEVAPHRIVQERLQATVESVAERLLLGRPLDQVLPLGPRLGETIGSVVDRVATGYTVVSAAAQLAAVSTVVIRMRPVGAVIRQVAVRPELRNVSEKVRPLVLSLLQPGAVEEIRTLYLGLPVAAMEWAGPLLEARVRAVIEEALAGFTAGVQVRADPAAQVDVVVTARDSRIVRNIGVRLRSTSIPTMLLDQHAPQIASMAEPVRGLPVTFAQAHRRALERLLNEELAAYPPAQQYRVVATAGLDVAETTYVNVVADSVLYRGRVEAQLNIGAQAPGPAVVAHLGRLVDPRAEVFAELHLVPNTLSMEWKVGGVFAASPAATVGFNYALVARTITVWTTVGLGRDVAVRGAWNVTQQSFEGALTYRINEVLSGELIGTSNGEVWLRLVSNL